MTTSGKYEKTQKTEKFMSLSQKNYQIWINKYYNRTEAIDYGRQRDETKKVKDNRNVQDYKLEKFTLYTTQTSTTNSAVELAFIFTAPSTILNQYWKMTVSMNLVRWRSNPNDKIN